MRRLALVLLASVALIAGCSHAPPAYVSNYTPDPPVKPVAVAIVGDSYTAGTPEGGTGERGWPLLMQRKLWTEYHTHIAENVTAEGAAGYVSAGNKDERRFVDLTRIIGPTTQMVILFGSRNDVGTAAEELQPAVRNTLEAVEAAAPSAQIVVIAPAWVDGNPPEGVFVVRDVLRSEAKAMGAVFVDPLADGWSFNDPALIGKDGIHPTDAGHRYLADRITPVIAQILDAPPTP